MVTHRLAVLLLLGAGVVGACGFDGVARSGAADGGAQAMLDGSVAGDGSVIPPSDSAVDAAPVTPACAVGKVLCGGACVTASDCGGCAGARYLCGPTRTCTSTRGSCTDLARVAMPIECVACDSNQSKPLGSCGYNSAAGFCLSGDYSAAYRGGPGDHCDCNDTDVANCPGRAQICTQRGGSDWCITCGEMGEATNGLPCKGGGKCNASLSPPRCM